MKNPPPKQEVCQKKERNSNLELYRILVMLLIVAHHYVVNSEINDVLFNGVKGLLPPTGTSFQFNRDYFFSVLGVWGKTGINCFVLITGYFMCTSSIAIRKFLRLLLEVKLYQILFWVIFYFCGYETFSMDMIRMLITPVGSITANFTSCFLVFFLFIPFLNILIRAMTQRQHLILMLMLVFFYSFVQTIPPYSVRFNYVEWFAVLYIIASYLRLHANEWTERRIPWGRMTGLLILFSCFVLAYSRRLGYYVLVDCNRFIALALGVSSFMFFKKLRVPQSRLINTIAASMFGVLLIHANSAAMRQFLWTDFLRVHELYREPDFWLYPLLLVPGIFIVCTIIDQLRIRFLEKPLFKWLDAKFQNVKYWK